MRRTQTPGAKRAGAQWLALAALMALGAPRAFAQASQQERSATPAPEMPTRSPVRRIVVSIPDRKLALVEDGRVVKAYHIAVGAPGTASPAGEFKIVHRLKEPTYYAPGKVIPPGEANPLGTRWLGLDLKGFGIHGTNEPGSIGRRASHGCIRMRNADVEELFELVRAGNAVELHTTRTTEVAAIFGIPAAPTAPAATPSTTTAPLVVAAAIAPR